MTHPFGRPRGTVLVESTSKQYYSAQGVTVIDVHQVSPLLSQSESLQ